MKWVHQKTTCSPCLHSPMYTDLALNLEVLHLAPQPPKFGGSQPQSPPSIKAPNVGGLGAGDLGGFKSPKEQQL